MDLVLFLREKLYLCIKKMAFLDECLLMNRSEKLSKTVKMVIIKLSPFEKYCEEQFWNKKKENPLI